MSGEFDRMFHECEIDIKDIQKWISENPLDSKVRYLTSYAVIRASGTAERVLKKMIYDYLSDGSNEEAKCFLSKNIIDKSYNPSSGQIDRLLQDISSEMKGVFDGKIKGSDQKGQLNALVELRNSISHGTNISASINDVVNYLVSAKWVLEQLYDTIYGNSCGKI